MRTMVVLMCIMAAAPFVRAESAKDLATGYDVVNIKRATCRTGLKNGYLRAELGQERASDAFREFVQCQQAVQREAKAVYSQVLTKLKTAAAKAALKDYQAALLAAIAAGGQKTEEDAAAYNQRVTMQDEKVEHAWQRLQVEL